MKFKLLIFDWDGTISDSLGQIVDCMHSAIAELDLPPRSILEIREIIGLGMLEAVNVLYPTNSNNIHRGLIESYHQHYRSNANRICALYPNTEETIRHLYDEGYYLAVATGKSRRGLDRALEESGMTSFFHITCCSDETFSKPHPQMLQDIMLILDIRPEQTLMIGDSEHDMQMAINANVACAAVNYGAHDAKRLLEFKPLRVFENLQELPEWLANSISLQ